MFHLTGHATLTETCATLLKKKARGQLAAPPPSTATLAMMAQLLAYGQGDFEAALAYLQESAAILERLKSPDAETVQEIVFDVWLAQVQQKLGEEKFQQLQAALAAGDKAQVQTLLGEA